MTQCTRTCSVCACTGVPLHVSTCLFHVLFYCFPRKVCMYRRVCSMCFSTAFLADTYRIYVDTVCVCLLYLYPLRLEILLPYMCAWECLCICPRWSIRILYWFHIPTHEHTTYINIYIDATYQYPAWYKHLSTHIYCRFYIVLLIYSNSSGTLRHLHFGNG